MDEDVLIARIVPHDTGTGWKIVDLDGNALNTRSFETPQLAMVYLPLPPSDAICAFNDKNNPSIYGFVPTQSPAVLPQDGRDWHIVIGFKVTQPRNSWIDDKVRNGIQIHGFQLIDLLRPS